MNPIYQTISGRIQATMEDGKLFIRDWHDGRTGDWTLLDISVGAATQKYIDANAGKQSSECEMKWGCILHCLTGQRSSVWYMRPCSEALTLKIEELLADRPKVSA